LYIYDGGRWNHPIMQTVGHLSLWVPRDERLGRSIEKSDPCSSPESRFRDTPDIFYFISRGKFLPFQRCFQSFEKNKRLHLLIEGCRIYVYVSGKNVVSHLQTLLPHFPSFTYLHYENSGYLWRDKKLDQSDNFTNMQRETKLFKIFI
jgi:hypothetical protein